jgi:hypothetical protein
MVRVLASLLVDAGGPTFRDRHGLKFPGVIMTVLFALVVAVQVVC